MCLQQEEENHTQVEDLQRWGRLSGLVFFNALIPPLPRATQGKSQFLDRHNPSSRPLGMQVYVATVRHDRALI